MSLFDFSLDGTGIADASQSTLDAYNTGSWSNDGAVLSSVTDGSVGAGYGYATGTDSVPVSASSQTLGQLQSGGSTIDWNQIISGGLATLVAADSISHGLTATGQALPTYKAPNGMVYPVGQGPVPYQSGGGFMMLLIMGIVLFAIAEEK